MSIQTDNFTEQRIIDAEPASPNEEAIERALRPKHLDEYVGQSKIRDQLEISSTPPASGAKRWITRCCSVRRAWVKPLWRTSLPTKWA